MSPKQRLRAIADDLREGKSAPSVTVREFLSWFGALRRGYWIVLTIRNALKESELETVPDFESAYMDSPIELTLVSTGAVEASPQAQVIEAVAIAPGSPGVSPTGVSATALPPAYADPTYRISKLAAANNRPVSVSPDVPLKEAVTIMLANDFSQLPVMTTEREVKGLLSWASIGARLALDKQAFFARDVMDDHHEIAADASIFQAIPTIVEYQYVLVRNSENRISGIVTASDLSLQFQQLAEPFLLLGEIENHIRRIIGDRFSPAELGSVRDPEDVDRQVQRVADLSFGEYIRLLEDQGRWTKIGLPIDRSTFCRELDRVREIRNDVMHFDPDGIPPEDLIRLRDFAGFLQRLQQIGVT
jgi:CBS domain-containing protein